MKKNWLWTAGVLACLTTPALTNTAMADPVYGNWKSAPGDTGAYVHVKIGPCGGKICGTITKVVGKKNPTSLGKSIIKNMQADGGGKYSGGTIWAPDKNKTYTSKMKLNGNSLSVSGCVAGGLFCRSQTWIRM